MKWELRNSVNKGKVIHIMGSEVAVTAQKKKC